MSEALIRRYPLQQPETDQHSGAANWSEAVEVDHGTTRSLHISGVVPSVVDDGAPLESVRRYGSMEDQTRTVFSALTELLGRHGYSTSSLVKLTCFMVEDSEGRLDLDGFGRAYRDVFESDELPARSRVVVGRLMDAGWLVEIEALAVRRA